MKRRQLSLSGRTSFHAEAPAGWVDIPPSRRIGAELRGEAQIEDLNQGMLRPPRDPGWNELHRHTVWVSGGIVRRYSPNHGVTKNLDPEMWWWFLQGVWNPEVACRARGWKGYWECFLDKWKLKAWESEDLEHCLVASVAGYGMRTGSLLRLKAWGWPATPQGERADSWAHVIDDNFEVVGLISVPWTSHLALNTSLRSQGFSFVLYTMRAWRLSPTANSL